MLCAMASRMPKGGIRARYQEVVEAAGGEEVLLTDIPRKVQAFFDQFVSKYGHCVHPMTQVLISPEIGKYEWVSFEQAAARWEEGERYRVATWDSYTRQISYKRPVGLVTKDYTGDLIDVGYLCTPEHTLYASVDGEDYSHISAETAYERAGVLRQRSTHVCQHFAAEVEQSMISSVDENFVTDSQTIISSSITKTHYSGKVYCFTTLTGFIIVRTDTAYITGNSSVMELSGSPSIFVEGVSPWTAFQSFDNPLVIGQEFSTRARRHRNWPIAREIANNQKLVEHHQKWLRLFNSQVEVWKQRLKGKTDNDPFRPALDRARWALPTTISTGFAHTANARVMGRVINAGMREGDQKTWNDIREAYRFAVPKIAETAFRERPEDPYTSFHYTSTLPPGGTYVWKVQMMQETPTSSSKYLHPLTNRIRVSFQIHCSISVMRDWHRHRTWLPFEVFIKTPIEPHPDYEAEVWLRSAGLLNEELQEEDPFLALHALPMGTRCVVVAQAGLRDFVYACQLRANAHGANFEYKKQAEELLASLKSKCKFGY